MGLDWYLDQLFREYPFWIVVLMAVFLGTLLLIWLLLPLWVLFIQWNTGKMREEIRYLADLLERMESYERKKNIPAPKE